MWLLWPLYVYATFLAALLPTPMTVHSTTYWLPKLQYLQYIAVNLHVKTRNQTAYNERYNKCPSLWTAVYPHMSILHPHAMRTWQARDYGTSSHPELYFQVGGQFVRFGASGGTKFPTMGDSLPRTPKNHCTKFDAASFILAGEICNRTNKHTHINKQTNSKRYIHTLPIGMCG